MSDDIKPALSPSEWRIVHGSLEADCGGHIYWGESALLIELDPNAIELTPDRLHAAAALCLHGQPFGFTQDDLRVLRSFLPDRRTEEALPPFGQLEGLASLAARIAALLPPPAGFRGIRLEVDPSVPPGTAIFKQGGVEKGRIVGLEE